ncbi:MAG: hypothetical protein HQL54_11695 [Magnetococcales bacterium]|nr:hypothetical protein [Magnetococcales bacterium]
MTTLVAEVYDAFKEAGASEEKSKAAAATMAEQASQIKEWKQEASEQTKRLATKEDINLLVEDISGVKDDINGLKIDMASMKAEMGMMRWLMGGTFFGIIALLIRSIWG